jgi:hypothetical protein
MMIKVLPAFSDSGDLNTGTPLLMVSIPVNAVHPVANACRMMNNVSGCIAGGAEAVIVPGPSLHKVKRP